MAKIEAPFVEAGQSAGREQAVEAAKKVTDLLNDTSKAAPTDIQDAANTRLEAIRAAAGGDATKLFESSTLDADRKIKDYCAG
jgi:protein subunit release factor A